MRPKKVVGGWSGLRKNLVKTCRCPVKVKLARKREQCVKRTLSQKLFANHCLRYCNLKFFSNKFQLLAHTFDWVTFMLLN